MIPFRDFSTTITFTISTTISIVSFDFDIVFCRFRLCR